MYGGSCLVAMLGGYSLTLAWDFSIIVVGVNSSCDEFVTLVVVCKLLSTCGVRFASISSRCIPPMCDVQLAHHEMWWRVPLKVRVRGCVLSVWGVGGSKGEVLSWFGARCSSLILMGFLLSSCEGLHSTYFWELVSICSRRDFL